MGGRSSYDELFGAVHGDNGRRLVCESSLPRPSPALQSPDHSGDCLAYGVMLGLSLVLAFFLFRCWRRRTTSSPARVYDIELGEEVPVDGPLPSRRETMSA